MPAGAAAAVGSERGKGMTQVKDDHVRVNLGYGDEHWELKLPRAHWLGTLRAQPLPANASEDQVVQEALARPVASPPLRELARPGEKVVILVGDMTRLWVRYQVLVDHLLRELEAAGVEDQDILIVSGTGFHREQTREEHRQLVGDQVLGRIPVLDHRATREDELVRLGTTTRGTPVEVNRQVVQADQVILTGGIVYHFLSGYGGGKKAAMPGVCSYGAIMANHKLSLDPSGPGLNPDVRAGKMQGNPLSEDMLEVADSIGIDFILNSVIDEDRHCIAAAVAGDMRAAHERGARVVDQHFGIPIQERADLVIASCGGYPKDIDFYQTYKTVHNVVPALKPGGTGIIISESREGIGNDNFYTIFTDYPDNQAREARLREDYDIASFMGFSEAVWAEQHRFIVVSSLAPEKLRNMNMLPARSLDQALQLATRELPPDYRAYIMPTGATTFPRPV